MSERPPAEIDDRTRPRDFEGFEERWRRWARRPPRTSPETAAHRVIARLEEPKTQPGRQPAGEWASPGARRLVAAALVLAAVGLAVLTAGPPLPFQGSDTAPHRETAPGSGTRSEPSPGATVPEAPMITDGVVLLWLDAETPLYMTFAPPGQAADAEKGEGS